MAFLTARVTMGLAAPLESDESMCHVKLPPLFATQQGNLRAEGRKKDTVTGVTCYRSSLILFAGVFHPPETLEVGRRAFQKLR